MWGKRKSIEYREKGLKQVWDWAISPRDEEGGNGSKRNIKERNKVRRKRKERWGTVTWLVVFCGLNLIQAPFESLANPEGGRRQEKETERKPEGSGKITFPKQGVNSDMA